MLLLSIIFDYCSTYFLLIVHMINLHTKRREWAPGPAGMMTNARENCCAIH